MRNHPEDWKSMTLGELLAGTGGSIKTGPFGTILKASEYSTEGVPIISVGEVGYGSLRVSESTPRAPHQVVERLPEYRLRSGDIVFGRKGAVDRSAWVTPREDGWFLGSDGIRLRLAPTLDARFIAYQIQSSSARQWLLQHATGSTMLSLSRRVLENLPVIVPPIAVQHATSDVLAALDDKIAANRKLASTADELARSQFRKFVGRSAASEMADATYGDVAVIGGGGTPKTRIPEYWDGDIPWATPTDVTGLEVPSLSATGRTITREGVSNSSAKLYPAGSILMTSRATIGAFAIAENPVSVNQGFIVVNAKDPKHQWWLFHEMRSRVDEYIAHANGATFLEIPRGRFKALPVTVPDDDVVAEFSTSASELHQVAVNAATESRTLVALRDTLLPRLMSGELRVRDAEKSVEAVL